MNLHCPCCHSTFTIEALTQDEAARELLAMRTIMLPSLLPYLTLFRSAKRALAFDRALKLAKEVMALDNEPARLEAALANAVESLRQKRDNGLVKPLKDHRYLKAVLDNTRIEDAGTRSEDNLSSCVQAPKQRSKRADALAALNAWAEGDWLRWEIGTGLSALVAQSLKFQPGADMITMNADVWYLTLKKVCTIEQVDTPRIRAGFERLFGQVTEWPAPKQLIDVMPARPPRRSLPEPELTEADRQRGREVIQQLKDKMGIT
ncbi:MAG: hypothetical protein PHO83_03795 [Geobacteraceae bacterium]|nr:hypothetical protein [Geobacteraceae bacterium]